MLICHKGHTDTIQVYSVTVMTHVKALQAGHSSQGTSEPITPAWNCNLRLIMRDSRRRNRCCEPGGAEKNFRGYGHCSDNVGETIQVAAVTKPKPPPDQLEDLLRWLLANMATPVPVPAPVQEVLAVAKLRQHLVAEIQSRQPAAVTKPTPPPDQLEDQLRRLLSNRAAPVPVPAPVQEVPTVAKLRQHLVAEIQSRQPAAVTKPTPPPDQLEDQLRRFLSNRVNKLL